jgi:hypothetical protein
VPSPDHVSKHERERHKALRSLPTATHEPVAGS